MRFCDIPGQEPVKERLRALADTGRLPHALLLEGPAGSFKLALIRALAQYIHCTGRHEGERDSCGRCPSCLQHQSFNHIDTIYSYPVVKTEDIKAPTSDDFSPLWQEFMRNSPEADPALWTRMLDKKNAMPIFYVSESTYLIRRLSLTGHTMGVRPVILWLPERMNDETANKLLKLIEEPFPDTVFLMASDAPEEILPTIYSRCQRIEVKRLSDADIAGMLVERFGTDPSAAPAIAHSAEGNAVEAIRQLSLQDETRAQFNSFVELMRLAYMRRVEQLRVWAENLSNTDRQEQIAFYRFCQRQIRENFIYNFHVPGLNYQTAEESSFSRNFAQFITEENVEKFIKVFNGAVADLAGNTRPLMVNFDVALKTCFLIRNR